MAPAKAHSPSTGSLSIPSSASNTSSSPERASPPDIVVSSSPTFNRRRDFKAAARKRSQEKNRLKKSSSSALISGNMSVVSEVTSESISDQKTDSSEELSIDEASFYSAKENLTICEDNEAEFSIMEESHTIVEISQKRGGCSEGSEGVRPEPGPRAEGEEARAQAVTSLSLDLGQQGPEQGASQGASPGGFWSSVVSSPSQEQGSPTESVRDILLQKRVSLSHTPDIVRIFQKATQAQEQHEFQKVKNELKPVEVEPPSSPRRSSHAACASLSSLSSSRSNMTVETRSECSVESSSTMAQSSETSEVIMTSSESEMSSCVTMTSAEETSGEHLRRSNSKDLILDLVPAPVEGISVGVKQEDKVRSKKAVKKERSQTTLISDVLAKEKTEAHKKSLKQGETPAGNKKSSVQSDSSLHSTNLIKTAVSKKLEKKGSCTNGLVSTRNSSNNSITDSKQGKNLRSRSLSQEKTVNGTSEAKKSKKISSERKPGSRVRQNTPLKDEMLYNNLNGENKENGAPSKPSVTTNGNVKGGFLAPTKSWLLYMGNQVDLKSRSPSPGLNIKERSPSPKRRMRESSSESDTKDKSRKSSVGPASQRKAVEKDPNLPIVRRSNSVKKKSAINGDVKGKDLTKKEVSNGVDGDGRSANNVTKPTATNRHKSTTNSLLKKEASASKLDPKLGAKTMSDTKTPINVKDGTESESKNRQKKATPPPVAPKPKSNGCSSLKQETEDVNGIKTASSTSTVSTSCAKISTESAVMAESSFVTQGSAIMQMSNCSNSTTTATTTAASATTASQEVTEVSGIEETSLKASEVIQKFETASKSSSELNILNSAISAHLMQDTVSSRLKKISAEEFTAMERKASAGKTESAVDAKDWSETSSKKSIVSKKSGAVKRESASEEKKVSTLTTTSSSSASATTESLLTSSTSNLESSTSKTSQTMREQRASVVGSRRASQLNGIKTSASEASSRDSNNQKTTMVVRLHPGQSRRLSAFMDYKDQTVNTKGWAGDIQCDDNPSSICGLEISFVSADIQDIDIKLIPVNQFCNINNPDLITDSVSQPV